MQLASSNYHLQLSLQSAGNGNSPNSAPCLLRTETPTAHSTQRARRNIVLGLEGETLITPAKLAEGRKQNLSYLLRRVNTDAHSVGRSRLPDSLGYQRRLHHQTSACRVQRSKVLLPVISTSSPSTRSATLVQGQNSLSQHKIPRQQGTTRRGTLERGEKLLDMHAPIPESVNPKEATSNITRVNYSSFLSLWHARMPRQCEYDYFNIL